MKKLLGILLILIGAIVPIFAYIFYCCLITIYSCSNGGAGLACVFFSLIATASLVTIGIYILTE